MASVTVMGGGILGLACAWEMARRGASVRVIEARHIGAGASGGHVGALAPHSPDRWNDKKAFQLDSLLMAPAFWAGVEAASNLPTGYRRTGRLQPASDASSLSARLDGAARHWPKDLAMRLITDPQSSLAPGGTWLQDDLSARLNPRATLAALASAIRAKGGEIIEGAEASPTGITLWTTGIHGLLHMTDDTGRPIGKGVKGQSALLDFALPGSPQIFTGDLYIVPHDDGTTAIGSTSENEFAHDRPDALLEALIARARAFCPALSDAPVLDRWAGIRPRSRSRAPLLGACPGRPGQYLANGGFKIGFGMAPKIATIMADLILEGQDAIPADFRLP